MKRRGIGGIFYDYQRPDEENDVRFLDEFWQSMWQCIY